MNRITSRFVLMIATAAILPLVGYGVVSVTSLRTGTGTSVREGNQKVAEQVAEQVAMYMQHNTRVLQSVGTELGATALASWQQERILRDYVLAFPEFREITIFDSATLPLATSALGKTRLIVPEAAQQQTDQQYIAPLRVDDDLLPTTTIAVRVHKSQQDVGWIVGEIALEALWKTIDRIRVGNQGYALIVGEDLRLIAHGNPDEKRHIADLDQSRAKAELAFVADFRAGKNRFEHYTEEGKEMLAAAANVTNPKWTVVVEQPVSEAMGTARSIERQLFVAIFLAFLGTVIVGYLWGRTFIQRIFALTRVTRSIAEGTLETRVALSGQDEIRELCHH